MLINEQEPVFHALVSQRAWLPLFLRAVILRGLSDAVFSFTCGWRDGKSEWAGDQEIWASYRFGHRGVMMEGAVRMLSHGVNHTSVERRECHHALGLELTFLCSGPAEWFGTPSTTRLPIRHWNYTELRMVFLATWDGKCVDGWESRLVPKCSWFIPQHFMSEEASLFPLSSHYDGVFLYTEG